MEYFAGLDVSMKETAICVLTAEGRTVLETRVLTAPEAIAAALTPYRKALKRVGHEAGSLSPWLQAALLKLKLPAVCRETRHVRGDGGAAQQDRRDRCAGIGPYPAHRLVPAGACEER